MKMIDYFNHFLNLLPLQKHFQVDQDVYYGIQLSLQPIKQQVNAAEQNFKSKVILWEKVRHFLGHLMYFSFEYYLYLLLHELINFKLLNEKLVVVRLPQFHHPLKIPLIGCATQASL